jgi:hypothetical protein
MQKIVSITTLKNRIANLNDFETAKFLINYCNEIDMLEGKNKRSSENWACNKINNITMFRLNDAQRDELENL